MITDRRDDGIGILAYQESNDGEFTQFRVAYAKSIDEFNNLRNRGTPEELKKYLLQTWRSSKIFETDRDAYQEAGRLLEAHRSTEYGIIYLTYSNMFPEGYTSNNDEETELEIKDNPVRLLSLGFVKIPVMEYDLNSDDIGMSLIADLVAISIEGPWFIHFDGQKSLKDMSFSRIEDALNYIRSLGNKHD